MKKLILAAAVSVASTGVSAADVEWNFGFGSSNVPIEEMVFQYNSQSMVTDSDGDGVISVGDAIVSHGGWGPNGFDSLAGSPLNGQGYDAIEENIVGAFNPNIPFPANYNTDYSFTFYFNDLMGEWDGNDFRYNSGTINFGVYDLNTNTFSDLFEIDIALGGNLTGGGQAAQIFLGEINEDSLENGAGTGFTLTENGKTQTLSDWLAGDMRVLFESNQTVEGAIDPGFPGFGSDIVFEAPGATQLIAANHTGRFSLNVPEPSTIAVLGLSLVGFAAAGRKRKA